METATSEVSGAMTGWDRVRSGEAGPRCARSVGRPGARSVGRSVAWSGGRSAGRAGLVGAAALLVGMAVGCTESGSQAGAFDDAALLAAFADGVAVPTYDLVATRATGLRTAIDALLGEPNGLTLAGAQSAWRKAREAWEASAAFRFGPATTLGLEAAIDAWPADTAGLDAVLTGEATLTANFVAAQPAAHKGFHALEYLLFGVDGAKAPEAFTSREFAYLAAIANEFELLMRRLAASWKSGDSGGAAYRTVFATAGEAGNTTYGAQATAATAIVQGMIATCDAIADDTLAGPATAHDPALVESRFSGGALSDVLAQLHAVQSAYLGSVALAGTSGRGLRDWLREVDAGKAEAITQGLDAALTAVGAIPAPLEEAITNPAAGAALQAAEEAVRSVSTMLATELLPRIQR